ncbi:MAG: hypothetical protein GC190_00950 [Alphaproteobacteria bacterium]|nr:hypothetical protein [Alphaproteobacteria bacterium]
MQIALIATVAVHVLAAVYWAGTTFALARIGGTSAERLFAPQMAAATIAVLSGGYLWKLTHGGGYFGEAEQVLAVGALSAIIAAGVQGMFAGLSLRQLRRGAANGAASEDTAARKRVAMAYRISAGLLVITIVAMTSARYL